MINGHRKTAMVEADRKNESMIAPVIDPLSGKPEPPEPPTYWDSPTGKAMKKGAKWGMIAGFVIAQIFISSASVDTPFGSIYVGNILSPFAFFIGLGTSVGAGIGWLSTQKSGDNDDVPPPPNLPQEPFG